MKKIGEVNGKEIYTNGRDYFIGQVFINASQALNIKDELNTLEKNLTSAHNDLISGFGKPEIVNNRISKIENEIKFLKSL